MLAAAIAAPFPLARAQEISVTDRPAVGLVVLDKLMSGRSRVGQPVHFEVVAPVYDRAGDVLIPAGCAALGKVTRSKGSGMFGRRGELQFTCEYAILPDGQHVPLTGARIGGSGTNDIGQTAAVTLLVSPLGLLIKGGVLVVNAGSPVVMYVADGARLTPTPPPAPVLTADFAANGKHSVDIVGRAIAFDGDSYTIRSDSGERTLSIKDIASISPEGLPTVER